jgi:hypothetical protein
VTPVLGAGASASIIGVGADVAATWSETIGYEFDDFRHLPAVAQFVATTQDRAGAGEYVNSVLATRLASLVVADLPAGDLYRSLPRHCLPVWLTTNYDDLIERALNSHNKPPRIDVARWTPPDLYWDRSAYDLTGFEASAAAPLVFHLHGRYDDPASMVISESDYLEFLEQLSRDRDAVLPAAVVKAIATTSLLFIGYSFRDVNLQLVLRQWRIPKLAYAVRPLPESVPADQRKAYADYYPRYLRQVTGAAFKVYWGTATDFCAELDARMAGVP